jgi:hypothetical protein
MPADDLERRVTKLEESIDRIERAVVAREGERDPLDELAKHVERIVGTFDDWRAQAQERPEGPAIASALEGFGQYTDRLLRGIRENTAATNKLLAGVLADGDRGPEADPQVLLEGEFLKQQLAGVVGTEGPTPLFKDAPAVHVAAGFEVLADAVCVTNPCPPPDSPVEGPTPMRKQG